MRSTLLCVVAILTVGSGCKRTNAKYCDEATPCAVGFACDLVTRECHSAIVSGDGGADMAGSDTSGCSCGNPTPICVAMSCVSCLATSDPEGACSAASKSAPHCDGNGNCVGCRDATDCQSPTPF